MDYKEKYEKAYKLLEQMHNGEIVSKIDIENAFPEFKKKSVINMLKIAIANTAWLDCDKNKCLSWLEEQSDTNETIDRDKFVQNVLRGVAVNIITWIDYNAAEGNMCLSNMECEDIEDALVSGNWDKIYAYMKKKLEKQGEQKTEPRFKVGDWVVFNNDHDSVYQIEKIENYEYTLRHILGGSMCLSFSHRNMIRAWTIEDAKGGDILIIESDRITLECLFIFKGIANHEVLEHCYYRINDNTFSTTGSFIGYLDNVYHPATKEQRDILFQKMKEAGYEWDANKKELRNIEQKSAWSEEDEKMMQCIHKYVKASASNFDYDNIQIWFRNLKNRVQPQQKQEWSEDDEKIIETMCKEGDLRPSQMQWLKSLKPQPHWKPTEEQMSCFKQAIDLFKMKVNDDLVLRNLNSLYNDLKKL